jgi:ABC-type lipoprotein release transport system permease subunit
VWATLLAQSTLIAVGALAIGLPLGVAIGRWSWSTWAEGIGVVDSAVTPVAFLALIVPVALAATILTTIGPARRASHLPVAETLRAE